MISQQSNANLCVRIFQLDQYFWNSTLANATAIIIAFCRENFHFLTEIEFATEIFRLNWGNVREENRRIVVHQSDALCKQNIKH